MKGKRLFSLMMSGVMTASMLPAYLTQISIPAKADDPPASDYTPDTSPTIDFDYADANGILNADDALKDLAKNKKTYGTTTDLEKLKTEYLQYPWRHVTNITADDYDEGSLRTLLESDDPDDTYVAVAEGEYDVWDHWKNQKWERITITSDKVLDLNGCEFNINYDANVNHNDDEPKQEYSWLESHYLTAFNIQKGATLTIIDSSAWRGENDGKGKGKIGFYAGWVDHHVWDKKWYDTRDLFHVEDGNLIIYGGTFEAGYSKVLRKDESKFSWDKMITCIGTAVELGVNIAKYATGISTAEAAYQDVLQQIDNEKKAADNGTKEPETQKDLPSGKNDTRNQSVSEKAAEKDSKIASGEKKGTPEENSNRADAEGKAKYDNNSRVAKAQNEIVNQAVSSEGIMGMVNEGFKLVDQIVEVCGSTSKPRVSDHIKGTVVRAGTNGTFVSYGGHYIGYGSTPNTRNAVVEVMVADPYTPWINDASKLIGGKAYIFDGEFEANSGANVFNICQGIDEDVVHHVPMYDADGDTEDAEITYDEHYGAEQLFYKNQGKLKDCVIQPDGTAIYNGTNGPEEVIPEPINTANIQVRGGTFRCSYDALNMAKLEPDDEAYNDHGNGTHFRMFPGTFGSVNLGVDSFGADLIRDGRIQIVDSGDGCLVLMDDQEQGYNGLYHYRLFCGDNELRTKSYLKVYPNEAQTNSSFSMQLAYYLGTGRETSDLFKEDENGDNIRSPYRQMENYFDFQIDDPVHRKAYSVKPNFHYAAYYEEIKTGEENQTGEEMKVEEKKYKKVASQWDVYGEKLAASEVWYYPTPLDKNGDPIEDKPYGNAAIYFGKSSSSFKASDQWGKVGQQYYDKFGLVQHRNDEPIWDTRKDQTGACYILNDRDVLRDYYWTDVIEDDGFTDRKGEWVTYTGIRTNMKYFTYKVYQVDPLTRENLNANGCARGDDPLLTVRYGCAPEETALKCKLPLDEVERRIKQIHPDWQGYRAGEMYRIVLEIEEQVGIGEAQKKFGSDKPFNGFGQKLDRARTTTSILFRCFEKTEQYRSILKDGETTYEEKYLGTDFTPVQWLEYPTSMHTIPAGRKHTVEVRNGKTGMTDWECDTRVFDMYYQWWEVDENGKEIKLLAGTDNIYVDGLDKNDERGTKYSADDKAKHSPDSWNLYYKKKDGKRYQYANTVDPNDPLGIEHYQQDKLADLPNVTGLPKISQDGKWDWTPEQIHMYASENTDSDNLFIGKIHSLENNKIDANRTDSCYIPMELIGKRIRVKVIALNTRWPLAYDKKQTFWSHTMEVCDPNSPEGYLTVTPDENEEFGEGVPATFSIQRLRDFYDGSMVASVTYIAYGKAKQFTYEKENMRSDLSALPSAHYPKDFSDTIPDLTPEGNWDDDLKEYWKNYDGVAVLLGLTDDLRLDQTQDDDYTLGMVTDIIALYEAPDLYGTFKITPDSSTDPNKTDQEKQDTFSITSLTGLNAGETISSVYFYAYGKEKSCDNLSIYDLKDLPEARYPVAFTDVTRIGKLGGISPLLHGDVFVRVTTSKGSAPYRTVYLKEEKPRLTGTVNITYDEDLSYATYDHPVTISLDDFKGLAWNEEITEVHYKLQGISAEKVFSTEDDPDVFKNGIPSAKFPDDFYKENSAGRQSNRSLSPYVTIVVTRNNPNRKTEMNQKTGTNLANELRTGEVIELGTGSGTGRTLSGGTTAKKQFSGTAFNDGEKARETSIYPENFASFQYVVKAQEINVSGKETEEFTVSDIQSGKYDSGIWAFHVWPSDSRIGFSFSDYTNTNDKVAVLVQDPVITGLTRIKLTGEPGEATFTMKTPDGGTVSKTVKVYQDFDFIEISGIKPPVIGEKLDFDSVKVPEDAPYHISDVKWEKGSKSYNRKTAGKDEAAAYYEPYTVCITVAVDDFGVLSKNDFAYSISAEQTDGNTDVISSTAWKAKKTEMWHHYDEETNSYLNAYTFYYTYPAVSDHETKVIDKIYMDFPTEVKEGDNFIKWLEDVNVYTNGYDDGMEFKLTPTFGPDAEKIAKAYGFPASSTSTEQLNYFIKGVQNGLKAEITIPDKMKETGDIFAASSDIKVYINGEEGGTFARMGDGEIWVMAPDTLIITDGEFNPPKKPTYSVSSVDAVVGEPITVKDLLVTDDPKVTIRSTGIYFEFGWEDYMTADFDKGIFTPIDTVQSSNGIRLTYVVEYDEDGDGYPEYQDSNSVRIERIYATAADVPKKETPPVENYGTAKVIVQDPDGREISKVDYKIRSYQGIPDPDGMFYIGFYDADGKTVSEYNFENGKTYYAKTVAADDFEIHAGVNSAYGFVRMPNGNTMSSIHISADGRHYLVGDYLRDLNPDTEYTLYYKHGADGKVYSKSFRTAKQDYGIMLGHDFVTDANPGNLEKDGWHYDADTKTLTLKNFTLNDYGAEVYTLDLLGTPVPFTAAVASQDALTLNLIGDNRIAFSYNDLLTFTVFAEKDLTITGNGNLTLTGNATYDLNSHTGNICLNGTGTLTFDSDHTAFYPENGEVLYTNGTIVMIPKIKTSYKDEQYQLGSLIQSKDAGKLNFSDKVHDIKIEAAGLDGKYEAVAESDLAALIQKNVDCDYEEEKSAIRITPVHKDVNKTATAETHESGTCDTSCTYHLSCDCGHIGEETFIMSAEEHSLVKHAAKAATCEEPGTVEYWECEICGERYADAKGTKPLTNEALTVPALGHKLTHHAGADATCTKAGIIEYWSCETCGERFADENGTVRLFATNLTVPATGHDWVQRFAKPATCETDGTIAHWVCSHCGQCSTDKDGTKLLEKEEVTIKAFGHKWSEWTVSKAATETAEGEEFRTCSVCGEVETRVIPVKVVVTTTVPVTTTTAKATTTTAKATTTTAKVTTTTAKVTTTTAKATTTTAKATTTTAKVTTTTAKVTTTTAKATTTTAKVTTTTAKATTTTAKATTTTAKVTTTSAPATTTTAQATTTTAKATTSTTKVTTTSAPATTTTIKATTTTAKVTTTSAAATTTTAKATTTTTKVTTTTAKITTTTEAITTTSETTAQSTTTVITSDGSTDTTPAQTTTNAPPEPEVVTGDVDENGEVSIEDVQIALKAYTMRVSGKEMGLTDKQIKAADVNEDGELSVDDVQNILIYYVNNTVAGKTLTWDDILGKKAQAQPRPELLTMHEDIWIDADRYLPETETA